MFLTCVEPVPVHSGTWFFGDCIPLPGRSGGMAFDTVNWNIAENQTWYVRLYLPRVPWHMPVSGHSGDPTKDSADQILCGRAT